MLKLLLLLLLAVPVAAQWRPQTSMPDGGWITAFIMDGDTILAGGNTLFKSTDRGSSWREIRTIPTYTQIRQLQRSDSIYLMHADSALWRSTDRGETWSIARSWGKYRHARLASYPGGTIYLAESVSGIQRSTDHGVTWTTTGTVPLEEIPSGLAKIAGRLYIGTFWGLYISSNDGRTWDSVRMVPDAREVPQTFHMFPDGTLAAGCEGGYYESPDSGYTWTRRSTSMGPGGTNILSMAVSGDTVWAGLSSATIGFTANRGDRWDYLYIGSSAYNTVYQIEKHGDTLWATTSGDGFFYSVDRGLHWISRSRGLTASLGIWEMFDFGSFALAATSDGLMRTSDGGMRWTAHDSVTGGYRRFQRNDALYDIVAKNDTLYLANYYDGIYRSTTEGRIWTLLDLPRGTIGLNCSIIFVGDTLVVSSRERGIVRFVERGQTWSKRDSTPGVWGWALARRGDTLYCAGDLGLFRSLDRGRTWSKKSNGIIESADLRSLAITPSGTIYAHSNGPNEPMLWRSTNAGERWDGVGVNVPRGESVHAGGFAAVGEMLFLGLSDYDGSTRGVWQSTDRGESWTDISHGRLQSMNIQSLVGHGDQILAGTQGYGIWRRALDELPPAGIEVEQQAGYGVRMVGANLELRLDATRRVDVTIVDALGRELAHPFHGSLEAGAHALPLDVTALPRGSYFCVVRVEGAVTGALRFR